MFAKSPTHAVFRPGNNGRPVTADSHPRCESTVGSLRKTIGPVTHVTSKTVIFIRDENPMNVVLSVFCLVFSHNAQNNIC